MTEPTRQRRLAPYPSTPRGERDPGRRPAEPRSRAYDWSGDSVARTRTRDRYGPSGDPYGDSPRSDPYGDPRSDPYGDPRSDPYGDSSGDPYADPSRDPHGSPRDHDARSREDARSRDAYGPAGRVQGAWQDSTGSSRLRQRTRSPWAEDLASTMAGPGARGRGGRGRPNAGRGSGGPTSGRPGKGGRRPHRLRRRLLAATIWVTVLALVGGVIVYQRLGGNLRSAALFAGLTGNAGTEKADRFGRVPLNFLLIGSDTRASRADCRIGGDCRHGGYGANADVEMVVHVAADRSNATVMSVPRDTVTPLPGCRSTKGATMRPHVGLINSTLAYGPGCTVAAIHDLTGIPIDHFVMVDFAGVVAMSDAVGGAQVCVSANVFDPYSHLKLAKGTHTLKGLAALEFVRSRHAFGDGSDLGRTYAQHVFLSAVIRNLKSAGTLANPVALYGLASAATRALTVDDGLASIPALLGVAAALNKVPTNRITFTTMQNLPDPADRNRVIPAPEARVLFGLIAGDQSLNRSRGRTATTAGMTGGATGGTSAGTGAGTGTATTTGTGAGTLTAAQRARTAVQVLNGSGVPGRAAAIANALTAQGFSPRTSYSTAAMRATTTRLEYGTGRRAVAEAAARTLGLPDGAVQPGTAAGLVLVVGGDWTAGTSFPAAAGGTAPATGTGTAATGIDATALRQAHSRTADQSGTCVAVSNQKTVVVNGVAMSPVRAYQASADVPVSAP